MFKLTIVAIGVVAFAEAQSALSTLSARMTVDNLFNTYLSTSATSLGTLFLSGSSWSTTYNGSIDINVPGTYWLHIAAMDQGLPAMMIGQFGLSGTQATFDRNGTGYLLSNIANFDASTGANPGAAVATAFDRGANGASPWGMFGTIDPAARFIWARDGAGSEITGGSVAYFSTRITVVPEPATLIGLSLGAFALLKRRKGA